MFSVPLSHFPPTAERGDPPSRQFCAAYFVDGRVFLSPAASSVAALFDLMAADQAGRLVRGEPPFSHLVIFEPADLTVSVGRDGS
jgi:hypothetical protein